MKRIHELTQKHPRYGYRRIAALLRREGWDVGKRLVKRLAAAWQRLARAGDHTVLAFGKPDTWSMKYNLVWDRVLGLNLFPPAVYRDEIASYLPRLNTYGLPLDNRKNYTKSDWILWTAAMTDTPEAFDALVSPVWKFANETTSRVPPSDWHDTKTGRATGFRARCVVGGYFMKVLADRRASEPAP